MNYNTFEHTLDHVQLSLDIDAMSVYRALEQVEDGRHKREVRYRMAFIAYYNRTIAKPIKWIYTGLT